MKDKDEYVKNSFGEYILDKAGNKMTQKQFNDYYGEDRPDFTDVEEAYRRGYCHGFIARIGNPELTVEDVYAWRHGNDKTCPPGSCFSGKEMVGLTKEDAHRFFINTMKDKWND
jgi:hypothetical protein